MPADTRVYLSLGSNLGDRFANLQAAIAALPTAGLRVLRRSSIYETEPVDFLAQPWFLNCIVEGQASLPPPQLLRALLEIELLLGSKKLVLRGPRVIDLDVIYYGSTVIRTEEIEIPHPRMASRRFVLVPFVELAPELPHPVTGRTTSQLLAATEDKSDVHLWNPK